MIGDKKVDREEFYLDLKDQKAKEETTLEERKQRTRMEQEGIFPL